MWAVLLIFKDVCTAQVSAFLSPASHLLLYRLPALSSFAAAGIPAAQWKHTSVVLEAELGVRVAICPITTLSSPSTPQIRTPTSASAFFL